MTTDHDKELMRKWVETWKTAGPELEKIRRDEIRRSDTQQDIQLFAGLATWALKQHPPLAVSGLTEQQRLMHQLPLSVSQPDTEEPASPAS